MATDRTTGAPITSATDTGATVSSVDASPGAISHGKASISQFQTSGDGSSYTGVPFTPIAFHLSSSFIPSFGSLAHQPPFSPLPAYYSHHPSLMTIPRMPVFNTVLETFSTAQLFDPVSTSPSFAPLRSDNLYPSVF